MPDCMHHLERVDARKFDGRRWHCRKCDHFFTLLTGMVVRREIGPVSPSPTLTIRGLARCAALLWLSDVYSHATCEQLTLANRQYLGSLIFTMTEGGQ